jgi:hypothetical protein
MDETRDEQITVIVKYRDLEQTFSGSINDVWVYVNKFFGEVMPAFDLIRNVILTVDLAKLIEDSKGVIAITPEGPELLVPKEKLTDSEVLQYYLLAAYIGFKLGRTTKETVTKEELSSKLGKNMKITATRLGELVKEGSVIKAEDGGYKISTIGIRRLQEELSAIKSEIW